MTEGGFIITTQREFRDAIALAVADAAAARCRELWWCDPDFTAWPLGEPAVVDSLTRWCGPQRRLTLLAADFTELARRHPRWVAWRRSWSHLVDCRTNVELEGGRWPTLLWAPGLLSVQIVDRERCRGSLSRTPADAVRCREKVDAVLQRSEVAWPVTTLGI